VRPVKSHSKIESVSNCIYMNRLRCSVHTWSLFYYVSLNPLLHNLCVYIYVASSFKNACGHSTGCSGSNLNVSHSVSVPNINCYALALVPISCNLYAHNNCCSFLQCCPCPTQLSTPFQLICRCSGGLLNYRFHRWSPALFALRTYDLLPASIIYAVQEQNQGFCTSE